MAPRLILIPLLTHPLNRSVNSGCGNGNGNGDDYGNGNGDDYGNGNGDGSGDGNGFRASRMAQPRKRVNKPWLRV
jgi:hypothetical protein